MKWLRIMIRLMFVDVIISHLDSMWTKFWQTVSEKRKKRKKRKKKSEFLNVQILNFYIGDLYEKPGKSPHAFCTSIDRQKDVRILTNIKQLRFLFNCCVFFNSNYVIIFCSRNMYWFQTTIHELGVANLSLFGVFFFFFMFISFVNFCFKRTCRL
jgi:hypothetical protein